MGSHGVPDETFTLDMPETLAQHGSPGGRERRQGRDQAWGLCAAYSLVNVAAAWLVVDRSPIGFLAIAAGATILFLATCARWTRTGRRWANPAAPISREKE